jgi:hypothetical protein
MILINKILKEDILYIIFKNWQWNVEYPHAQAVLIKKRWYSIKQHILWQVQSLFCRLAHGKFLSAQEHAIQKKVDNHNMHSRI